MSGKENDEGIPAEVPQDSSDAVITEPTDSVSNEVQNVRAVNNESAASVVDEAKPSVSNQQENSDARPSDNRFMSELRKASNLHCPFVWRNDLDTSYYLDHELDLLSSAEEMFDDLGFRFRRYIIHLVLCYHNFYKRNIKECMEHLEELDRMMKQSSKKDNSDYLFNTINDALYHVIHSCRIYIFDTTEQKERTAQILNKIKSFDTMNNANKAGLWAIRANVYVEYGYEGVKNAVSYMRKAVTTDPDNAFWHFMKGMFMGRLRRMEGGLVMPENEEFQALRTAIELREDPAFIAFAGEAYLETAKTAKRLHVIKRTDKDAEKQVASLLQDLNEVAAKYFKKSIELKPNSSHLLFRCGKGLINLPPPHQDIKMGLDFIRKGLEISPDSGYGNHAMAMFLDKIEKNPTLAKEFLDISIKKNNFPAHLDMIRIEYQESKDGEKLFNELNKMLQLYKEMPRQRKILGELVCYRLFVDYDLVEACFYMRKLIQLNSTKVDVINDHKTMILPLVSTIPLSDLIFNRIKAAINDRKLPDVAREVLSKYIKFLMDESVEPQAVKDECFAKIKHQIELGFKNKQKKPVDEHIRNASKRVRNAHEFEADPCGDEELSYLNYYKNDMEDTNVGKTRGVGDEMMNMLRGMGQNPLPKRRFEEDMSERDRSRSRNRSSSRRRDYERERGKRHSSKSSRSSRSHRRRRSYSSSSYESSSSSSSDRNSKKHRRSSRGRRRSPSSSSSYSSSSSSSSDRYSKSSRRHKDRRHRRRSSSYDKEHSRDKGHRKKTSNAKSRHQKKSRRDRSPSTSYSSSSDSSSTSKNSTVCQLSKKENDSKKLVAEQTDVEVATEASHAVEQLPKTNAESSVDHVQAIMDSLSIDSPKLSRKSSPQPTAKDSSDVGDVKSKSQNSDGRHSGMVESSEFSNKSGKQKQSREDRDGSVKSATSGTSKRSSKRRSRDRSVDSARTNCSRTSKRKDRSSRKRSSSSSSSSSSLSERSRYSSSHRHKRSEQYLTNSPDLISERLLKDDGRKDRDRKKSKHSEDEKRRRREKNGRDRKSETVSSPASD